MAKNGTALIPKPVALELVLTHRLGEAISAEHLGHLVARQADLAAETGQFGVVADQAALLEIGAQQALLHRVLEIVIRGEVDEAMRVERVARAGGREVEGEALARGGLRHLVMRGLRLLAAHAVLAREMLDVLAAAFSRSRRVELEAAPGHVHLVGVLELPERRFEATLADEAPGARDV